MGLHRETAGARIADLVHNPVAERLRLYRVCTVTRREKSDAACHGTTWSRHHAESFAWTWFTTASADDCSSVQNSLIHLGRATSEEACGLDAVPELTLCHLASREKVRVYSGQDCPRLCQLST